jgi:hypothetical protein
MPLNREGIGNVLTAANYALFSRKRAKIWRGEHFNLRWKRRSRRRNPLYDQLIASGKRRVSRHFGFQILETFGFGELVEVKMEAYIPAPALTRPATLEANSVENETTSCNTRPVFVLGCPRSGTTVLYHMILSSGNFAGYPFESDTFRILGPKFPGLTSHRNRARLLDFWLRSSNGAQSGLERSDIEARLHRECCNIGDFLRIVMEAMCRKQGVHRWAEKTPDHLLSIAQIKRFIPDSLIVHIIRDGRDSALSLANFGRIQPYFWQRGSKLLSFGVYWKWLVRKGRASGRRLGRDYYEVHYEDLMERPHETLARLGNFIGHELDYDRIAQVSVGALRRPNTSFEGLAPHVGFSPVSRWKRQFPPQELATFEALVGDCLEETGYSLATTAEQRGKALVAGFSTFHASQLELKYQLKTHTPLRRLAGWRK